MLSPYKMHSSVGCMAFLRAGFPDGDNSGPGLCVCAETNPLQSPSEACVTGWQPKSATVKDKDRALSPYNRKCLHGRISRDSFNENCRFQNDKTQEDNIERQGQNVVTL